jgi:hypothetical protein
MPTAADILGSLTTIANDAIAIAVLWHAIIAASLFALGLGWRPSARVGAMTAIGLAASVSAVAFAYGNPFNGASFALLTILLGRLARRLGPAPLTVGASWTRLVAVTLIAYGLMYPHFLEGRPLIVYAVAAPVGLVPCPTLAVITGLTLLATGVFPKPWAGTLAAFDLFYAVFGIVRLGVVLDAGLLIGALVLAVVVLAPEQPTRYVPSSNATLRRP